MREEATSQTHQGNTGTPAGHKRATKDCLNDKPGLKRGTHQTQNSSLGLKNDRTIQSMQRGAALLLLQRGKLSNQSPTSAQHSVQTSYYSSKQAAAGERCKETEHVHPEHTPLCTLHPPPTATGTVPNMALYQQRVAVVVHKGSETAEHTHTGRQDTSQVTHLRQGHTRRHCHCSMTYSRAEAAPSYGDVTHTHKRSVGSCTTASKSCSCQVLESPIVGEDPPLTAVSCLLVIV
jgi:hypothetical protein